MENPTNWIHSTESRYNEAFFHCTHILARHLPAFWLQHFQSCCQCECYRGSKQADNGVLQQAFTILFKEPVFIVQKWMDGSLPPFKLIRVMPRKQVKHFPICYIWLSFSVWPGSKSYKLMLAIWRIRWKSQEHFETTESFCEIDSRLADSEVWASHFHWNRVCMNCTPPYGTGTFHEEGKDIPRTGNLAWDKHGGVWQLLFLFWNVCFIPRMMICF